MLVLGVTLAGVGFVITGRRVRRTRFRPDRWRAAELGTVVCGAATAVVLLRLGGVDPEIAHPSLYPLHMPEISLTALIGVLVAALPAWFTPLPPPSGTEAGR